MKKIVLLASLFIIIMSSMTIGQVSSNISSNVQDNNKSYEEINGSGTYTFVVNISNTSAGEIISDSNKSKITIITYRKSEKYSVFDVMPILSIVIVIYISHVIKKKREIDVNN